MKNYSIAIFFLFLFLLFTFNILHNIVFLTNLLMNKGFEMLSNWPILMMMMIIIITIAIKIFSIC